MLLKKVSSTFLKPFLQKPKLVLIPIQNAGHWLKDHKPAPRPPTTTEGIVAAAEKYNLLPAEYKTFPDDGFGYGDYPKIPLLSGDAKDTAYPWDQPSLLRNFNEVIDVDEDAIADHRCNRNMKHRKTKLRFLLEFLGTMGGLWTLYAYLEDKKMFLPLLKKQYPDGCQIHYTFEQKPPPIKCEY